MYPVSDECKIALNAPVQMHSLRGTCGGKAFTGNLDVVKDTFRLNKQMCDATEVRIGGVYVGQLQMTFTKNFANTRGGWMGKVIEPEIGILVNDDFEWIPAPSGQFIIHDAVWTAEGLQVIAYDNMSKFDKNINLSTASGSAYDFLNAACLQCGVRLGMTAEEVQTFPNGSLVLGLYPTETVTTWRDMLGWLAQTLCAFATIDRTGALVLVKFPMRTNNRFAIDVNHRYTGASFSDFDTFFTEITVVDIEDNVTQSYSVETNNGLTMNLGANPFLQYGTPEIKEQMRNNILLKLTQFEFAPFSASTLLNPTFELGDVIEFVGGIARGCISTVMSLTLTLNTSTLDGFGDNPALANALSSTDKEVNGVAGANQGKKIVYFTYSNVGELEVTSELQQIADIRFTTSTETTVDLWLEVDADYTLSGSSAEVEFTYFLNGDEISYHPTHVIGENGPHIIGLNYYLLNIPSDTTNDFRVAMRVNGATADIPVDNIHLLLRGQGLIKENTWDGRIEVKDLFSLRLDGKTVVNFVDGEINISQLVPDTSELSDVFSLTTAGKIDIPFTDTLTISMREKTFRRITEDGSIRMTEDNDYRIT